jgi:hypothetical protein
MTEKQLDFIVWLCTFMAFCISLSNGNYGAVVGWTTVMICLMRINDLKKRLNK